MKAELFNDKWEFIKLPIGSCIQEVRIKAGWQRVDIPHDWVIYDTASFHESCEGWYRKYFTISRNELLPDGVTEGNRYLLRFEGIYMESTIYLNNKKAGEWKYGYSTFELDITDALKADENELIVQAVLQVPNSRWYTGGGIYRNVWLKKAPKVHLPSDGIYISTKKTGHQWEVRVESEVIYAASPIDAAKPIAGEEAYQTDESTSYSIRNTILDRSGTVVACTEGTSQIQLLYVASPEQWDLNFPVLYTLKTELLSKNTVLDEAVNRFGFRTIRFGPDCGFLLNDQHIKLHGVCQHHDLGALGAAVNRMALRRQLTFLKEMGVNAVRTAHNMCAVELLELADEMGILINEEAFDMWERPKNPYDYARFFKDWAEKDVASWIRRDRNHPCIIMWGIGNEIYDTHADEHGQELTRRLMDMVHQYDTYHNASVTIGSNYMPWENAQSCADIVKLAGYNYAEQYYRPHHVKYPDWSIYGSETGSIVQSRGIYHFPQSEAILCDDDEQCSSLGNSITSWGAKSIEKCILEDRDTSFSAGMFIWSGFDYIGEPTPYHTKNSYFGQLDTAGFRKDSFYVYQSAWTDYRRTPMIHLFPYWDFNEGQMIDIRVCSNAPKVELFYNDLSEGICELDHQNGTKLIAEWRLPYHEGELKAVAYDEDNNIIAEDTKTSFSDAAQIILAADKAQLFADGRDLVFVEISMKDKNANPVQNANNRVHVKVSGAGRLIGLDNGDSTDYDSYKETSRRLFSGKLLAIIAARTIPGEVSVEVTSAGLPAARLVLTAVECEVSDGITAIEENEESPINSEVPIRKIEIISTGGTHLFDQLRELEVEARLYPECATYHEIIWRAANAAGAASNIVKLIPKGNKATVQAIGDGTFYLRAAAANGREKICLISVLDFEITGLGSAFYNPYEFISGSLYNKSLSSITIGSGNERGVATAREGESIVVFDQLDFGSIGSEVITVPIFELDSKPTPIEIWEGIAHTEGSELLAEVVYHEQSIWNVYQEQTYRLMKRLTGITVLSFLLRSKVHIKGFFFTKRDKAYEQLSALAFSRIYGDSYTIGKDCIIGIGNNVTITFDEMDFGVTGFHKLVICGRSVIEKNTIQVLFTSKAGESKQLAEFLYSGEFVEREFKLDRVDGMQSVSFVFLPGCSFDFQWFRFDQ